MKVSIKVWYVYIFHLFTYISEPILSLSQSIVLINSENKKMCLMGSVYKVLWILKALWIVLSETIIISRNLPP